MIKRYSKIITVTSDDLDDLNHVNNVRYVQWIQDISKEHWVESIRHRLSKDYIWVVSSHFIEYKRPALLNDQVSIETFIEKFEGSISHRVVEIKNAISNKIYVRALTKWCLLNPDSKRPLAIPKEILDL